MGNRAVILFEEPKDELIPAVYLHWNGGIESIQAFCEVCKSRQYRDPTEDPSYAMARFVGVCHEFFGINSSTSLGIITYKLEQGDAGDNGIFVIGKNWKIVRNFYDVDGKIKRGSLKNHDPEKTLEIEKYILSKYKETAE